jgi:hypothetical protein
MGALYSFNFSLKVEEFTYRSIAAIKQSRSCYTINCDTFIVLLLFLFKDLLLISRCSDPLEMLVLYNHKNKMMEEYQEQYKKHGSHFSDAAEMREFYEDGIAILDWFKKKRSVYFSSRGTKLIGIEMPLQKEISKNVIFKGYIDLVMYHEPTNTFKIYDFKTSTRGWNEDAKKDERKQFQLLFYKKYFSEQFGVPEDNIDVEFIILKRKIWEESEYPQSRIQEFAPPSGKIKMKKALTAINNFINECFDIDGTYKDTLHLATPSKTCQWCPYNERKDLCNK